MIGDVQEISKIDAQLEAFKTRAKFFGSPIAMAALGTKTPAQWWESYGDEHPELQKFAIRVLSLTCSSSGCERNWSAFEMIHTKRRNRLKQKTMNDVVFVMTNSKLAKKKKARKVADFTLDDIDSDNEWIVEDEGSAENEILDFTIESEDLEGGTQNEPEVAAATVEEDECEVHNLDDEFEGNEDCMEDMGFDENVLKDLIN
ncbi:hAT dimerization domain-containing protein / transposase protein [Trifolium repens]|nr:hAT dimerization domain-containing protein / transposase protein [Trifolium repens]